MSMPAFRGGDPSACSAHGGATADPAPATVLVNGRPLRVVGDHLTCADGSKDVIRSGASQVVFKREFVARLGELSGHGTLGPGSPNVVIGSPSVCGGCRRMKTICAGMAAGRPNGRSNQSANNCGVESMRQLIAQATGNPISEKTLLEFMIDHYTGRLAAARRGDPFGTILGDSKDNLPKAGGTQTGDMVGGLRDHGVPAHREGNTPENIQNAVDNGQGVIAGVWAGTLWKNGPHGEKYEHMPDGTAAHAIVVTGLERDASGKVIAYIINDTGIGTCRQRIPAALFERSLMPSIFGAAVTDHPIF